MKTALFLAFFLIGIGFCKSQTKELDHIDSLYINTLNQLEEQKKQLKLTDLIGYKQIEAQEQIIYYFIEDKKTKSK